MNKYYYNNGVEKFGPFTKEELHIAGITSDTQVWCEGMPNWAAAGSIEELSSLFADQVPPIVNNVPPVTPPPAQQPTQQKPTIPPSSNLVWAILTTVLCCLPFGVVAIVYAARVESTFYAGNYDLARKYSKQAATWAIVSASAGFVFALLYFILVAAAGMGSFLDM